jgi:hypothetical protein
LTAAFTKMENYRISKQAWQYHAEKSRRPDLGAGTEQWDPKSVVNYYY